MTAEIAVDESGWVNAAQFETVGEISDYSVGYEWAEGELLRHKVTGNLYFIAGSGCSCNSLWDCRIPEDFTPVATWQDAVEVAKASGDWEDEDVFQFALALSKLR